jgi:hypothetical protein
MPFLCFLFFFYYIRFEGNSRQVDFLLMLLAGKELRGRLQSMGLDSNLLLFRLLKRTGVARLPKQRGRRPFRSDS